MPIPRQSPQSHFFIILDSENTTLTGLATPLYLTHPEPEKLTGNQCPAVLNAIQATLARAITIKVTAIT
ncbi:hypothetical protein GCM10007874_34780 [Labrys miyagiensis]|uniref:Uncharacterized protein n=1 Tax=Labrys miyagiensis TaxID=346912 RepID=A0ABQ6CJM3_9HYPH|nr:hypothetical protein GCM10007874_34780 [Labrys miyagiensis]